VPCGRALRQQSGPRSTSVDLRSAEFPGVALFVRSYDRPPFVAPDRQGSTSNVRETFESALLLGAARWKDSDSTRTAHRRSRTSSAPVISPSRPAASEGLSAGLELLQHPPGFSLSAFCAEAGAKSLNPAGEDIIDEEQALL